MDYLETIKIGVPFFISGMAFMALIIYLIDRKKNIEQGGIWMSDTNIFDFIKNYFRVWKEFSKPASKPIGTKPIRNSTYRKTFDIKTQYSEIQDRTGLPRNEKEKQVKEWKD